MNRRIEIGVLGPLLIRRDGVSVEVGGRNQRLVLAALCADPGRVVPVDRLVEAVWDGDPPRSAIGSLQAYVSRLRKALGSATSITRGEPGYALSLPADSVDAVRFERLVRGAGPEPTDVARTLEDALGLWRGPAFAEFADLPLLHAESVRLEELRLTAIEQRGDALIRSGDSALAVAELEALVEGHGLRERPWVLLATALAEEGRQAEALRQLDRYGRQLADVGLEPSAAVADLVERIVAGGPRIADGPAGAASTPPAAPATRISVTAFGNLPAFPSSFVGRHEEVRRLADRLTAERLVTLVGPGGVGKSRLAIEAARRVQSRFSGGAWLLDLAPISAASMVGEALAALLGIPPGPEGAEPTVRRSLRARRMLLVVDNCEHLVEGIAPLIEDLVLACPSLTVLATSLQRLGVSGEAVSPLEPLPMSAGGRRPAVDLFYDRARAADPGFDPGPEGHEAVLSLVKSLEGLPLAIEMAAARVRSLDPAAIAARLDERLDLLRSDRRTVDPRHRTLREVVAWSYDLLDEEERQVFCRLSVFGGDFELAAAEEVGSGPAIERSAVVDVLDRLVGRSVVGARREDGVTRFRILDALRRFGAEQLVACGEARETGRRHAMHYAGVAEAVDRGIRTADEAGWERVVARELDNLRAALVWSVANGEPDPAVRIVAALQQYGYHRGRNDLLGWAEQVLGMAGALDHPRASHLCATAAQLALNRGAFDQARRLGERGLALAGHGSEARFAQDALTDLALYTGRLAEALERARGVERLAVAAGDRFLQGLALLNQSLALGYGGERRGALGAAASLRGVAGELGSPTLLAWADYAEGELLIDHDPDRALLLLEAAAARAAEVRNGFIAGVASVSATSVRARHGDPAEALAAFADVIDHWYELGDWSHQWVTLRNLVVLLARVGAAREAATLHAAAAANGTGAFGAEAERLEEARSSMAVEMGSDASSESERRGRAMTAEEAVAFARRVVRGRLGEAGGT